MMRFTRRWFVWLRPACFGVALVVVSVLSGSSTLNASTTERVVAGSLADSTAGGDYVARLRASFTPENRAYSRTRVTLALLDPLYDVAVAALLLFTGLSARFRDAVERRFRRRWARSAAYTGLLMLALLVLNFPRALYGGFIVEHQYALSTQSFGAWLLDDLKALGANWVAFGLTGLVGLMLWVIARNPRHWWLWLGAATLPLLLVTTLLQPLVFDPLFNKFTPLRDPQLGSRILALAERADIPARHVYQVDRSKQTRSYNAYVSGFGASQRIVLWDTILQGMKQDEILFVMGHEMGHYRLAHIWKGIALSWALSFLLLGASSRVMSAALRRYGARWRVTGLSDLAALPLLFATLSVATFVAGPVINAVSREIEHEADGFGIEITRDNDAAARAFIKLASQNRSNPEPAPWLKWLLYTHPPVIERVRFAMTYRPWETGRPNRYFRPRRR